MFSVQNYQINPELFYESKDHFWIKVDGTRARIGMDPLVQESMGAFVVVQLDKQGKSLSKGESFGTVEAEKYVGPLRSPVSGKVMAINDAVVQNPRLANTDPYNEGWFIEIELANFEQERNGLVTGEEALRKWLETELKKYQEEGWLAES
ncbi:hypothetical protein L0244_24315, partial [bacterium]|nr:glycine cleavage system protein H [bacterium]MCI0616120.1 hypothetical protein [bacterium]